MPALRLRSDVEEGGETVFPAATDGESPDKGAFGSAVRGRPRPARTLTPRPRHCRAPQSCPHAARRGWPSSRGRVRQLRSGCAVRSRALTVRRTVRFVRRRRGAVLEHDARRQHGALQAHPTRRYRGAPCADNAGRRRIRRACTPAAPSSAARSGQVRAPRRREACAALRLTHARAHVQRRSGCVWARSTTSEDNTRQLDCNCITPGAAAPCAAR